jgi:hypothetical protein
MRASEARDCVGYGRAIRPPARQGAQHELVCPLDGMEPHNSTARGRAFIPHFPPCCAHPASTAGHAAQAARAQRRRAPALCRPRQARDIEPRPTPCPLISRGLSHRWAAASHTHTATRSGWWLVTANQPTQTTPPTHRQSCCGGAHAR